MPSLYLFLLFSFSLPPIARRDDTLLAGDKGSRARGRTKLEMLILGMVAKEARDGKGEADVNYETVLILSFIPTRISRPERKYLGRGKARRRDGCVDERRCFVAAAAAAAATSCMRMHRPRMIYTVVSLEKSRIILGLAQTARHRSTRYATVAI